MIIVPSSASDPRATYEYDGDGDVIDLVRSTSADGLWYLLAARLTLTGSGNGELEIRYAAGSSEPSILGLYQQ